MAMTRSFTDDRIGPGCPRDSLARDPSIAMVMDRWQDLTVVLLGIGSAPGSRLLRESGNSLAANDRASVMAAGAVGDVCLRFFDAEGGRVPEWPR